MFLYETQKRGNQGKRSKHKFGQHNVIGRPPVLFKFSEKQHQLNKHLTIKANLEMNIPSPKRPHRCPSFLDYSFLGSKTKTHFVRM